MGARFGRGPNGRALKADGTERKARATLSPEEKMAQIEQLERNMYAGIGRKILAAAPNMGAFVSGLGTFKRWVRECVSFSDAEKRTARRAYYQAQIDAIDAKGVIADTFLPDSAAAIETINGLYSAIGEGYQTLSKAKNITEETVGAMIADLISEDVREIVEDSNDPDNDPYADYRRGASDEDTTDEDSDTL